MASAGKKKEGVPFTPQAYRRCALEHAGALQGLFDSGEYVLAAYISGLAVECILRAYRLRISPEFDSRHNLYDLSRSSGIELKVPRELYEKFESDLSAVAFRWSNSHRYRPQDAFRRILKQGRLDRGIKGDFVRENVKRMLNSAIDLVMLGDKLWTR